DNLPDPTADENLDKPSGRGVMLMRIYMNSVAYNKVGNSVEMFKARESS
ncbi:MAG: ATP-binding protein, partial [Burkholderiales bacterium]|nr:ATP-binding protein [Burkholderiales bacterium]